MHTHEHNYLALKKNETLVHVTAWENLKDITVMKKAIYEGKYCIISLIQQTQNSEIHKTEAQLCLPGWKGGRMGCFCLGIRMGVTAQLYEGTCWHCINAT